MCVCACVCVCVCVCVCGTSSYGEVFEVINFQSPCTRQFVSAANSVRGDVATCPDKKGHTFIESIGGSPEAAARWSVGSCPARCARVAYQSAMCTMPSLVLPQIPLMIGRQANPALLI